MRLALKISAGILAALVTYMIVLFAWNRTDETLRPEIVRTVTMPAAGSDAAISAYYYWLGIAHEDPIAKGRAFEAINQEATSSSMSIREQRDKLTGEGFKKTLVESRAETLTAEQTKKLEALFAFGDYVEHSPPGTILLPRNLLNDEIRAYVNDVVTGTTKGKIKDPYAKLEAAAKFLRAVVENRSSLLQKSIALAQLRGIQTGAARVASLNEKWRKAIPESLIAKLSVEQSADELILRSREAEIAFLDRSIKDAAAGRTEMANLPGGFKFMAWVNAAKLRYLLRPNATLNHIWDLWDPAKRDEAEQYANSAFRRFDNPAGAFFIKTIGPKFALGRLQKRLERLKKDAGLLARMKTAGAKDVAGISKEILQAED